MKCIECGHEPLERRSIKRITPVGSMKVEDNSTESLVCPNCGHQKPTFDELVGFELRAVRFVPCGDLNKVDGAVLKTARKALGLRQTDLAERIGRNAETLSRYENGREEIPIEIKLAVAALVDRVTWYGPGALALDKPTADGDEFRLAS